MQTSSNYGLKLPEGTDNVKRQDFVDNFKLIDATMKSIDNKANYYGTTSGTNTYTTSIAGITAYTDGLKVTVKIGTTSTGTSTLNINELGEKTILDNLGNAITSGGLKAGIPYNLCYNGTNFIVLGKGGGGDALPEHVLINKKVTVDSGPIVGTMPNNTGTNKALGLNETWTIPKGYHDGNGKVTQDIPNNEAINANLNCGESKNIPAGYTSGGTVAANSLASQTPANADASTIIAGRNAWVNGNLITGNAMKAKSIATIETIKRNGIGWTAGGTVEITFNTPFDILLVGAYIIVNNGQLQMNYLPAFSDNRIVLSISDDRRTLYMRNTSTSCGWNDTVYLFSINYKE